MISLYDDSYTFPVADMGNYFKNDDISGGQNDDFRPLTYTLGGRGMGCREKYVTS
jgi:hypothetical protein